MQDNILCIKSIPFKGWGYIYARVVIKNASSTFIDPHPCASSSYKRGIKSSNSAMLITPRSLGIVCSVGSELVVHLQSPSSSNEVSDTELPSQFPLP